MKILCLLLIWNYSNNSVLMTLADESRKSASYIYLFFLISTSWQSKALATTGTNIQSSIMIITFVKGDRIWWHIKTKFQ